MIFQGTVQPGFGTGAFYVSLPHYYEAFTELLKKSPFPGTLNVLFSNEDYHNLDKILDAMTPLIISGKNDSAKGNWRIECYCTRVWGDVEQDKVRALLLRFSRPDHKKEIIEFVSAYHLRGNFHLEDNSPIHFRVIP